MKIVLCIAAGGAVGAVLRHQVGKIATHFLGPDFPWGTISVNIIGSFIMGMLVAFFGRVWNPPQELRAFFTVGCLGAFTTFSTFSLDAVTLFERTDLVKSGTYVLASVFLSITALFLGIRAIRLFA